MSKNATSSIPFVKGLAALFLVIGLIFSFDSYAQVSPQFYSSTYSGGGNVYPFRTGTAGNKVQWLYPAGKFTDGTNPAYGGLITSVYIKATAGTSGSYKDLKVELGHTSLTTLTSGTWESGLTKCFEDDVTLTPNSTNPYWVEIPLTKPFPYNPKKALILSISNPSYSGGFTINQETVSYNGRKYGDQSSTSSRGAGRQLVVAGIDVKVPGPNNAGVVSIDSPSVFCGGTQSIYATIENTGSNQIKEVTVNWSLDGKAQTPIAYKKTLDTIGGSGNTEAQIYLGSATFNTKRTILVYTTKPNNVTDTVTHNDSLQADFSPALSGNIYVGAKGDYQSLGALADDLSQSGVCGPVTVYVRPGTYTERMVFGEISGVSATNKIQFISAHTDSVTIQYTGTSAGQNTIQFDGTEYVSFKNFTIEADGSSGFAVSMTGGSDYNKFTGCIIQANPSARSTLSQPLVLSGSASSYSAYGNSGNYNIFTDNTFIGGYYGVCMVGASTSSMAEGNEFIGNTFKDSYYYGLRFYYVSGVVFKNNTIGDLRNTYNYGMYIYFISNFEFENNTITETYYGNFFAYANYYSYRGTPSVFANNMIAGDNVNYALYAYYLSHTNFWHNSIYGKGNNYLVYSYYLRSVDIRNNIFYYDGSGDLWYARGSGGTEFRELDNNDFYTNGSIFYLSSGQYRSLGSLSGIATGLNKNNYSVDPEWVDNGSDLHLTGKSPSMFGANVGITEDIDGDKRCVFAPSIGVDEKSQTTLPPVANFLTPDTVWMGTTTSFLNYNKPSNTSGALWYVNGVATSDSIHLEYTATNTGMDTISLVMENCSGKDSITKLVYVSPILRAPKVDFSATSKNIYTGDLVSLLDLSENGVTAWEWDITPKSVYDPFLFIWSRTYFFDGKKDSLAANPSLYFEYPGIYSVKLKVGNSFGDDSLTKTAYIKVRQRSVMCNIPWDTDGSYGTLYDDGGPDGNYSAGKNGLNGCTYLISSCKGAIDLDISQFDLEKGDYLKVFDGADIDSRPLWDISAYPDGMTGKLGNPSVVSTFKAQSGSAYFVFESDNDNATLGKGFAINWEIDLSTTWSSPTASISMPDTACVGFVTTFENTSTGNWSGIEWDLDNDGTVEGIGNEYEYTFTTGGTYEIKLSALSLCATKDSVIKKIFIESPKQAPTPDFTTSATLVAAGDTVYLEDNSTYCSNFTMWEISPADYQLIDNGKETDENLGVVFTKGGFFDVKLVKGNTFGKDSLIKTSHIQVLDYCTPNVFNLDPDFGISRVEFGDIDNSSAMGRAGYNNYLSISTSVEVGHSYDLTIERSSGTKEMSRKAWIDWNIDGDFEDANELVAFEASNTTSSFTATVTVPGGLTVGKTRLRVATSYKNQKNTPCGPHAFGEFEDYTVNITADLTPPVITLSGLVTEDIEVGTPWVEAGYKSIDLVDGDITSQVSRTAAPDENTVGTYLVTYTSTDAAGNTTTVSRTINIVDTTVPTIELLGDDTLYVEIFTSFTDPGTIESDNYDPTIKADVTSNVDTANLGTYSVDYCVTDANGNGPACVTRTVIVFDDIFPKVTLLGNDPETVEVFSQYTDAGIDVVENHSYTTTTSGTWTGSTAVLGTYKLTYTVVDPAGNTVVVSRTIEVVDTKAPVIALQGNGVEYIDRWSTYTDAGYVVSDNYYDEADLTITVGGDYIDTQSEGIYYITYTAEDPSANVSTTVTRAIIITNPTSVGTELEANSLTVYPNPSTGLVNIAVNLSNSEVVTVNVVDALGKVLMTERAGMDNGTIVTMNLSDLGTGVYFIEVNGTDFHSVKPVNITK